MIRWKNSWTMKRSRLLVYKVLFWVFTVGALAVFWHSLVGRGDELLYTWVALGLIAISYGLHRLILWEQGRHRAP